MSLYASIMFVDANRSGEDLCYLVLHAVWGQQLCTGMVTPHLCWTAGTTLVLTTLIFLLLC